MKEKGGYVTMLIGAWNYLNSDLISFYLNSDLKHLMSYGREFQ